MGIASRIAKGVMCDSRTNNDLVSCSIVALASNRRPDWLRAGSEPPVAGMTAPSIAAVLPVASGTARVTIRFEFNAVFDCIAWGSTLNCELAIRIYATAT